MRVADVAVLPLVVLLGSCDSAGADSATLFLGDLVVPSDGLDPRDCLGIGAGIIARIILQASSVCDTTECERAGSRVRWAWTASQSWSEAENSDVYWARALSSAKS